MSKRAKRYEFTQTDPSLPGYGKTTEYSRKEAVAMFGKDELDEMVQGYSQFVMIDRQAKG